MSVEADLSGEIMGLRDTVTALGQGLRQMLEVQETHTAMLERLLLASAAPASDEVSLSNLIVQLITTLQRQHSILGEVKSSIDHLPNQVGAAVSGSVRDVLAHL